MAIADWRQHNISFVDRVTAQNVAVNDLLPALTAAQDNGLLHGWWFIRKDPWRLRYLPDDPASTTIADLLDKLAADGRITGWAPGIYEPETTAFGGEAAMEVAHALFHIDSRFLLAHTTRRDAPARGQRETSVVLCSVLLHAAGLDWYEQGDVWHKVAELRPSEAAPAPQRAARLTAAMRRLMTADVRSLCDPATDGVLADGDPWLTAFERAGQAIAHLARHGRLERGLRAVLAHHIVFHANRAGLSVQDQAALAHLAVEAVFAADGDSVSPHATHPSTPKVDQVTTISDDRLALTPERLRSQLVDRLRARGTVRTARVEAALRRVPRELFLPGFPVEQTYDDDPIYTKTDATGTAISAASQPTIVALMLEQLDAHPGHRVAEAGAGTGYNAALLGAIVGETGRVTTIDVDQDLVNGAREHLAAASITNVEAVLSDGALGHPGTAPFDRFIATVGAHEVPTAWLEQLAPGGRLVVPVRLRGTNSRSIAFERGEDGWHSVGSELAVFMPLRGIGDDASRIVTLTPQADVTLQVHKDQDVDGAALTGVLDTKRHEHWTGVLFPAEVPYEWMDLWLSCTLEGALMRMSVQASAKDRGQVTPMFGWGSMATVCGGDLAYLTTRPAPPAPDGTKLYEVGAIGHGSTGDGLAAEAAGQIRLWDEHYRAKTVSFTIPDTRPTPDPSAGRFILPRNTNSIVVSWK